MNFIARFYAMADNKLIREVTYEGLASKEEAQKKADFACLHMAPHRNSIQSENPAIASPSVYAKVAEAAAKGTGSAA